MANSKADAKGFKRNRLLVILLPLLIIGSGLFLVQLDTTPDINYKKEVIRPGYQTAPAEYQVEASSHKEWGDYWANSWGWALAGGLIILIGSLVYISYLESEVKEGSWVVFAVIWLGSLLLILLPFYSRVNGGAYETKLTPEQYEAVKTDLDSIFPL